MMTTKVIQPVPNPVDRVGAGSKSGGPLIRVSRVSKAFGGVQALREVSLDIYPGEVHGLIGANGAGKSTLIRILSGDISADSGAILLDGEALSLRNPQDAYDLGFSFIHQELNLVPTFSIIENMTLGMRKPKHLGLIDWKAVRQSVRTVVQRVGIDYPLETVVSELSVADQWLVSIAHALMRKTRIISMDEPTAALSSEETRRLFRVIRDLAGDGVAVLYVSHRLDEIMDLCDGISVFKDGVCVLSTEKRMATRQQLVEAIVGGKHVEQEISEHPDVRQRQVLLGVASLQRGPKVKDVSFRLHSGEVLGLAGLVGSGRTEVANIIYGVDTPEAGRMTYRGKPFLPRNPTAAIDVGIGLVPEERRSQGLILSHTVGENLNLINLRNLRWRRFFPLQSRTKAARISGSIIERLRIKTPSERTAVRALSGGNQQKVVIGKWLTRPLSVLIFDEPSRGVDVGARAEIHARIRQLASEGRGIIVISSDNEELPFVCDTVHVMAEGRIVGTLRGSEITKEAITHKSYEHLIVGEAKHE